MFVCIVPEDFLRPRLSESEENLQMIRVLLLWLSAQITYTKALCVCHIVVGLEKLSLTSSYGN